MLPVQCLYEQSKLICQSFPSTAKREWSYKALKILNGSSEDNLNDQELSGNCGTSENCDVASDKEYDNKDVSEI